MVLDKELCPTRCHIKCLQYLPFVCYSVFHILCNLVLGIMYLVFGVWYGRGSHGIRSPVRTLSPSLAGTWQAGRHLSYNGHCPTLRTPNPLIYAGQWSGTYKLKSIGGSAYPPKIMTFLNKVSIPPN